MEPTNLFKFNSTHNNVDAALDFDNQDPLRKFRNEFCFPSSVSKTQTLYFAGHSLGLMPKLARTYVTEELDSWETWAVEGHFEGNHPWLPYHEFVTPALARLVGANEHEVVAMNSLTVNLHLMLVSFYRPTKQRFKILIENNTFPSDRYAVESQIKFHGFDPKEALVELKPKPGKLTIDSDDILEQIRALGDSLALVMLGNCNYLSGQKFDFQNVTKVTHEQGAFCGFNLAHGAGNLELHLHQWNVDFAVWCSYKYLNSGPGGIAGAFVHSKHHQRELPRFTGWWGQDKKIRFKMGPDFVPIQTVEAWQLSNPPIFQLASLRASLKLFDEATIQSLALKSAKLTEYFRFLVEQNLDSECEVVTPKHDCGSMLCLRFKKSPQVLKNELAARGVTVDFREPDIIRATPVALYNSFEDVFNLVHAMKVILN